MSSQPREAVGCPRPAEQRWGQSPQPACSHRRGVCRALGLTAVPTVLAPRGHARPGKDQSWCVSSRVSWIVMEPVTGTRNPAKCRWLWPGSYVHAWSRPKESQGFRLQEKTVCVCVCVCVCTRARGENVLEQRKVGVKTQAGE